MTLRHFSEPPLDLFRLNPRLLRPVLRAYGLGLLSYLSPRVFNLLLSKARRGTCKNTRDVSVEIIDLIKKSLELHRFPAFCGITIAGWQALELVLRDDRSPVRRQVSASFISSFVSSFGGIWLLNSHQGKYAGRTLDLTLFTLVRAVDVVLGELWNRRKDRRMRSEKFTRCESAIGKLTDPVVFSLACGAIMYSWFYLPDALPRTYRAWITNVAQADSRLIIALQRIRAGEFVYGKDTGQAPLLQSYCEELGLPKKYGDPNQTCPIPCTIVHGARISCEENALRRFWGAWKTVFPVYLGLNMLQLLRLRKSSHRAFLKLVISSARSASFLGTFVCFFWYAVCLTRTRLGPSLFPRVDPIQWEKLCVKAGCIACGWSVMIENPSRQAEMMFFVTPRALATLLPRRYDAKYQWIESLVFALSTGVVLTAARHRPHRIRGVFGKLLETVVVP